MLFRKDQQEEPVSDGTTPAICERGSSTTIRIPILEGTPHKMVDEQRDSQEVDCSIVG